MVHHRIADGGLIPGGNSGCVHQNGRKTVMKTQWRAVEDPDWTMSRFKRQKKTIGIILTILFFASCCGAVQYITWWLFVAGG